VGINFDRRDDGRFAVSKILPNSPAAALGVTVGDIIDKAEGYDAKELGDHSLLSLIRGEPGTPVHLVITSASGGTRSLTLMLVEYEP
jgi:C-terminal processing protease CtpA/Prc